MASLRPHSLSTPSRLPLEPILKTERAAFLCFGIIIRQAATSPSKGGGKGPEEELLIK
jgi:hypothetical protein